MFDDCLHDNSLLAELKEWSRFYNVPAAASLGHQVLMVWSETIRMFAKIYECGILWTLLASATSPTHHPIKTINMSGTDFVKL